MDLDALKARLAAQDAKLDQALRLNTTAVRELQLAKTRASLRWLLPGVALELVLAALAAVWLGDFLYSHLQEPRFFLPALLLDLGAIALLASCVGQLAAAGGVDYSLPVVAVQKRLARLRVLRLRTLKWTAVLSFALWLPVLVVMLEGLLGVDLWRVLGAVGRRNGDFLAWLVGNVAFGLAAALLLLWASRRYGERAESSPVLRRLLDGLAGRSLTSAQRSLDAITRFEAGL